MSNNFYVLLNRAAAIDLHLAIDGSNDDKSDNNAPEINDESSNVNAEKMDTNVPSGDAPSAQTLAIEEGEIRPDSEHDATLRDVNRALEPFPSTEWSKLRHQQAIASHIRRLTRIVNQTALPIARFDENPVSRRYHQVRNNRDWQNARLEFIDSANDYGVICIDTEHDRQDDQKKDKPTLVLIGTPDVHLTFWTKRERVCAAMDDLPEEMVRMLRSGAFIKMGAGIVKDFHQIGMEAPKPLVDLISFWDRNEQQGFLPERGEYSNLGWFNTLIHGHDPRVDHKTRKRAEFAKRHHDHFTKEITVDSCWNKYRSIFVMFEWLEHRLKDPAARGYCAYDTLVPPAVVAYSLLQRLHQDGNQWIGFSLAEIMFEHLREHFLTDAEIPGTSIWMCRPTKPALTSTEIWGQTSPVIDVESDNDRPSTSRAARKRDAVIKKSTEIVDV